MGEFQSSLGLVKNVSVLKMKHLSMPMSLACIYFMFYPVCFYFSFFKEKKYIITIQTLGIYFQFNLYYPKI